MLTIDDLRQYGANVQEGMERCMNDESFYLMMVNMTLDEKNFDRLSESVKSGDRTAAFEAAHALKGITANVALSPLYEQIAALTEILRPAAGSLEGKEGDCQAYVERIIQLRDTLLAQRDGVS